jgi:hypothetical protein
MEPYLYSSDTLSLRAQGQLYLLCFTLGFVASCFACLLSVPSSLILADDVRDVSDPCDVQTCPISVTSYCSRRATVGYFRYSVPWFRDFRLLAVPYSSPCTFDPCSGLRVYPRIAVRIQASVQCSLNVAKAIFCFARGTVGRLFSESCWNIHYSNSSVVRWKRVCHRFSLSVDRSLFTLATQISVPLSDFGFFNPSKRRSYWTDSSCVLDSQTCQDVYWGWRWSFWIFTVNSEISSLHK